MLGPPAVRPVLDAFANNEVVALDEALDDLTVSLLSCTQLAGYGLSLANEKMDDTL